MWCNFFEIYEIFFEIFFEITLVLQKVNVLSNIICNDTFLKACGSGRSGTAPTFINLTMSHVTNQLIFKIIKVQKFFILGLKFKNFLKNTFKYGFARFLKIWCQIPITQYIHRNHQHKQSFQF